MAIVSFLYHFSFIMFYVYILKCFDNSLYTGIAKNLIKRIEEHNFSDKGAKYTKGRRPVELVYKVKKSNRSEASKEECRIKNLSRADKLKLIGSKKYERTK